MNKVIDIALIGGLLYVGYIYIQQQQQQEQQLLQPVQPGQPINPINPVQTITNNELVARQKAIENLTKLIVDTETNMKILEHSKNLLDYAKFVSAKQRLNQYKADYQALTGAPYH